MSSPNNFETKSTNDSYINQDNPFKFKKTELFKTNVLQKNIFESMTEKQAIERDVVDLFFRFDKNGNKQIDKEEFQAYSKTVNKDVDNSDKTVQEELEALERHKEEEQFKVFVTRLYEKMGVTDELKDIQTRLKDNKSTDVNTLAKEQFGVDLSQYKTEKEKQEAFTKAIANKYEKNLDNKDSIYAKHYERLLKGEFTDFERENLKLNGDLSPEQAERFASRATNRDQLLDVTRFFADSDDKGQIYMIKSIGTFNNVVQTGIIGAAVLSGNDKETREHYANLIKEGGISVTDQAGLDILRSNIAMVMRHLSAKDSVDLVTGGKSKFEGRAQIESYKVADKVERYKVKAGEITQKEYDNNYVKVYAASAYKLKEAGEGYKYVIDNANDNNRKGAMNTLASNAYQIKDDKERDSAVTHIKKSDYYDKEVGLNLTHSLVKKVTGESENHGAPLALKNPEEYNSEFNKLITPVIKSGNENTISEFVNATMNDIEVKGSHGVSAKEKEIRTQSVTSLLNMLISTNKIQGTKYESLMLKKLGAAPIQTLLNIFFNCNEKAQTYFYKNNLVQDVSIAMNASGQEIKSLPDDIQEKVENIRGTLTK